MTVQRERFELYIVCGLLLITLAALFLSRIELNKSLVIDSHSRFPYSAIDDHSNGGASAAHIKVVDNQLVLECEILQSNFAWPYCETSFNLIKQGIKGTDLSQYNSVKLWIKYSVPQDAGIRFQMRNFNPIYSNLSDEGSLKYNSIEFYGKKTPYPVVIPLHNFQVPTWWLVEREIPIDKMGSEFNNIHSIEIATGSTIKPGKYTLVVERIEFVGKYISEQNVYFLLLVVWGSTALFYIASKINIVQNTLKESHRRQLELESLNRLLNVDRQQLEEKLARDPLTGVLNRDGIANLFEHDLKSKQPKKLSIIFIDIDYFKKINDSFGHNVGDDVLILFARVLFENTREIDVLARWGGEEFILACPNTDAAQAAIIAEKLRTVVEVFQWPLGLKLTASFGVAEFGRESPTDFIGRADKALYDAKAAGRNCVMVSKVVIK